MRERVPWLLALLYAVLLTILGAWRYDVHRNFVDFGIFAQTIASAFGCFCNPIEGSHWAFHFSPILYVAGAVVLAWHSAYALIVLSAIGGALAIPPVYALVRRRSTATVATLSSLVAFLYPPLAGVIFNDFHENAFAPAAVLWTFWAFDAGRIRLSIALAVLAMCVKEDQAIFLGIAGAAVAFKTRGERRRAGAIVAVAAAAILVLFFAIIQPHAQSNPSWSPTRFYAWTNDDVSNIGRGIAERIGFFVIVFAPLLFLPLRSPLIVFSLAPFAEIFLSRMSTTYTNGTHYAGAWIGYVLAAFTWVVGAFAPRRAQTIAGVCIVLCVVEFAVANPLHPGLNLRPVQLRDRLLDAYLVHVPPTMALSTQEEAYTHLAIDHPDARLLPERSSQPLDTCFVLIDRAFAESPRLQEYGQAFDALVASKRYAPVDRQGTIGLYKREGCP